jgi:hypothetical protein
MNSREDIERVARNTISAAVRAYSSPAFQKAKAASERRKQELRELLAKQLLNRSQCSGKFSPTLRLRAVADTSPDFH